MDCAFSTVAQKLRTDTTDAEFSSRLEVIEGTGSYESVSGDGEFEGSRNDELGGVVEARFHLDLALP